MPADLVYTRTTEDGVKQKKILPDDHPAITQMAREGWKPTSKIVEQPLTEEPLTEEADLTKLNKPALQELATEKGISFVEENTKAQLIEAIEAVNAAAAE